ncbi:MAG: TVP38/TMEM64 family protein, partial [Moorea sp. SIO2I5]|nr:TVP38/TMEM64 family protein [Moorena sp. SIO2I5]
SGEYTLGTFFGIIPGTLAYTWLGVTGGEALQGGDRLPFFLALSFLGILSALPLLAKGKKK